MINFFSKYKFIFYLFNLILILLYLFPGSILGWFIYNNKNIQPQISPNFIVSTNHVYAFLILSLVGFLSYKRKSYFYLSFYLIFLSLILEIMHIFIPQRGFEFADLFGNLVGVIIIIILSYLFKVYENFKD